MEMISLIQIPGSKSYTNRALIMGALTKGPVIVKNPLYSEDTEAMIGCLRTLGIKIETETDQIVVHGDISSIEDKKFHLFARDSGTTVRFMLALLCIVPGVKIIEGSKRLNERPIKDLVDALRELGALIEYCGEEGFLPVKVATSTLSLNSVRLKGDMSSQFCSALLLIAPCLPQGLTIHITGRLISKPYVDMTVGCMKEWGVNVVDDYMQVDSNSVAVRQREKSTFEFTSVYFIPPHQSYRKKEYLIEGDFSSAAYFFAIAALTKSTLTVNNLNPFSLQADRKFLEILAKMGNLVREGETSISVEGKGLLPLEVDMEDCPDQVMTMAVLAAFANGVTKISGVRSLRVKETERVLALKTELGKMGIRTEDTDDTLTIYGGSPHGAEIETYNDHRIAMAFAVAAARLPDMAIRHPQVVNKTFPAFWEVLRSLD